MPSIDKMRWFVRYTNNNEPIQGTLVKRFKKPAGSYWKDVTDCLQICCTTTTTSTSTSTSSSSTTTTTTT